MQLMLLLSNFRLFVFLFGALVFFSMSWLYADALAVRKQWSVFARSIGAAFIGFSFLLSSVMVGNISLIANIAWIVGAVRILGYVILGIGVWGEPLSKRPFEETSSPSLGVMIPSAGLFSGTNLFNFVYPLFPAFVGLGYLRRTSVGLERHLKSMSYGMYVMSIAEILDMRRIFVGSGDIRIFELVREFGFFWALQIVVLLIGLVMISSWVFGYLLRRFETQLTLFMSMMIIGVFAISTSVFTFIMAGRMEEAMIRETQSGNKMVISDLDSRGLGLLGEVQDIARKSEIVEKVEKLDKENLVSEAKKYSGRVNFYNMNGESLTSESNISSSSIFGQAKLGKSVKGFAVYGQGSSKKVFIQAGGPVKVAEKIVGVVVSEVEVSDKQLAGLSENINQGVRVFVDGEVVVASSIPGYSEIESTLGLKTTEKELGEKKLFKSNFRLGGVNYVSSFGTLKNSEGVNIATLESTIPMNTLWGNVEKALVITYGVGVLLLLVMELPAVLISRFLTNQLK